MKPLPAKKNFLLLPRIVITVSIILISLVSYYFITGTSNILQLSSRIGAITSYQRTLCSQIINSIAADNIGGVLEGPPLEKTLAEFVKSDTVFFRTNSILNEHLEKQDLSYEYANLNNAYGTLLKSIAVNVGSDSTNHFVDLLTAENDYLKALDKYASALNSRSTAEVQTFRLRETTILVVSLALVFLEIIFLFLPAIRKINKQNRDITAMNDALQESHELLQTQLKEIEQKNEVLKRIAFIQSHEVRHPLTCIMALVNLADQGHPIDEQWLQMMHTASQSLDTRIRTIVKESQTDKELKVMRYDKMIEEIQEYAIFLLDAKGNIEIWNKGAENLLGYTDFEVIGKNFSMFYTDANKKVTHIYYLLEQAANKGFVRDESPHRKKDGSEFFASTLLTAIHDDDTGEIAGFTGVIQLLLDVNSNTHATKMSA